MLIVSRALRTYFGAKSKQTKQQILTKNERTKNKTKGSQNWLRTHLTPNTILYMKSLKIP